MFKVVLKSSQTDVIEIIELEGDAFTTEIDNEDLGTWIREYAEDNEVAEASVTYEVVEVKDAIEVLEKAILAGELHYYCQTGSTAYVAEYEDGKLEIVYNDLSAKEARPNVNFEIVASAEWEQNQGYPCWNLFKHNPCYPQLNPCDARKDLVAVISTDLEGNSTDNEAYYY